MRFRPALVFAILTTALVAWADDSKPTRLPFKLFAEVHVGDWWVMTGTVGDNPPRKDEEKMPIVNASRVTSVDADSVAVVTTSGLREPGHAKAEITQVVTRTLPRREAPLLDEDFGRKDAKTEFEGFKDEKRTVGGREFACKRLDFKGRNTWGTVWFAAESPNGVLAYSFVGPFDIDAPVAFYEGELAGFGTAEKTLWGKTPDELFKALDKR